MSKEPTLKEFPQDPAARTSIKNHIQELVDCRLRMEAEKELVSSIKETAKEKYNIDGGWLVVQANIVYDRMYQESKDKIKKEEAIEFIAENEAFFGISE